MCVKIYSNIFCMIWWRSTLTWPAGRKHVMSNCCRQENPYPDVRRRNWFNNAVSTASNAGVFQGFPDGTFRPEQEITRAEFIAAAAEGWISLDWAGFVLYVRPKSTLLGVVRFSLKSIIKSKPLMQSQILKGEAQRSNDKKITRGG